MPKNLKILLDARMVTPQVHGIGRYALNLIRGLAARGHDITILSHLKETPDIIGKKNFTKIISCRSRFAHPQEVLELSLKTRRHGDFDIIHFPSFAVPAMPSKNSVITICDLTHLRTGSLLHHLYYKTVVKHALLKCAQVITISEWTRKDVLEKLKTPAEKVSVVRIGLEEKWFAKGGVTAALPVKVRKPYFLSLSNPKPHKNVNTLVTACQQLWNHGHDFRLVLSLGGSEIPDSWKLSAKQRENIYLLKNLGDEELFSYFTHALAVVSPSFYEGFDYPVAEALSLGKTAVISAGSAHQEFQGHNLRMYKPADNVPSLSACLSQVLSIEGSGPLNSHNISHLDQMIDDTLKVYEKVVNAKQN